MVRCTYAWWLVRELMRLRTDYETDSVIQRSLREAVSKDTTVLTIAHRLQTIMDADKIVSAVVILVAVVIDRLDRSSSWTLGAL